MDVTVEDAMQAVMLAEAAVRATPEAAIPAAIAERATAPEATELGSLRAKLPFGRDIKRRTKSPHMRRLKSPSQ